MACLNIYGDMEQPRIIYLTERYLAQTATAEELSEFFETVRNAREDHEIMEVLAKGWLGYSTTVELPPHQADELFNAILMQAEGLHHQPAKIAFFKSWKRIAAAAILIILGIGAYFFINPGAKEDLTETTIPVTEDVAAPANIRATITLSNGQRIYLDSVGNGQLATQDNVKLVKLSNGELAYQTATGKGSKEIKYNTLVNPRGSQVATITLADGSKVWLNAGSSITFPIGFVGSERKVSITGEAYFEVAHNPAMPFEVSRGETKVQVLGTRFNVNAYDDEADIKVTLLEGSVKTFIGNRQSVIIKPGQQAQVSTFIKVVDEIDLEQVMAWKNGVFKFRNTNIEEIMRQLARWYDVEISYQGNFADLNFGGTISREANVSELLKRLEATEACRFIISDRKITVVK